MKKKEAMELAIHRQAIKKKIDLIEKSAFKKKYTYDFNGEVLEVKNHHKPKRGAMFVHMNYSCMYDQEYVERLQLDKKPELGVMYEFEESKGAAVYRYKPKNYGKGVPRSVEVDED